MKTIVFTCENPFKLRDLSLFTGRGATNREGGGTSEVLPLRKCVCVGGGGGGARKVLPMLKWGHKFWGSFIMGA